MNERTNVFLEVHTNIKRTRLADWYFSGKGNMTNDFENNIGYLG